MIEPLKPQYFECDCHSSEHTLRFAWDDEDNSIYTTVFLSQYHRFFKRVWMALKYMFGHQSRYGHFDCFIMQPEDAERLKQMLNLLK